MRCKGKTEFGKKGGATPWGFLIFPLAHIYLDSVGTEDIVNHMPLDIKTIGLLAAGDNIALKRHSILRMRQRRISTDEVKDALLSCRLIENYPTDRPLPSGLVLGYTADNRAIHAVVAIDEDESMLWVITVYEPSLDDWEEGFDRRRTV